MTCWRVALKRGGAGRANWGKPGDELFDDINDFDCTQASHLEDALATAGFKWSEVQGLSDEDHYNMDALEQVVLPPALDLLPPPSVQPPRSFISSRTATPTLLLSAIPA